MTLYFVTSRIAGRIFPILLTVFLSFTFAHSANAASKSPFDILIGSWGGSGILKLRDGTKERIRCNAYYTGGGSQLGLAIRCISKTQKVEVRSKLSYSGGRLTGSWEERTYNAGGKITGTAKPGQLKFSIQGSLAGTMKVSFNKTQQEVSITTNGIALKSVKVKLARQ